MTKRTELTDGKPLTSEEMEILSTAKHELNDDYPVVVSLHPMTGVAVEYCVREHKDFDAWAEDQRRLARTMVDTTVLAVVKDIERGKAAGRPMRWQNPRK